MATDKRWLISFSPDGSGKYRVEVRRAEGMVPDRFHTRIPPDTDDLVAPPAPGETAMRSFRSNVAELSPEARLFSAGDLPTLKEVGDRLLNAMFDVGNGVEGYEVLGVLKNAISENDGLELQIDLSEAPELSAIPWESLYLKSTDSFLGISKNSNIVRRMDAQRQLPDPIERPIRLLVVSANPREDLDTSLEIGNIEKRIDQMIAKGKDDFRVEILPNATRNQFRDKVGEFHPHIIHYIGHSSFEDGEGHLYFETGEKGVSDAVTADELRFMLINDRPWLVVLNSCESGITSNERPMAGVAQNLLCRLNIPFVVAMQQPISDDAAIAFSQKLYAELTAGETVANAVTAGRSAIFTDADIRTKLEIITPALYTTGAARRLHFVEQAGAASPEPERAAEPAASPSPAATATSGVAGGGDPVMRGHGAEPAATKAGGIGKTVLAAIAGAILTLVLIVWAVSGDEPEAETATGTGTDAAAPQPDAAMAAGASGFRAQGGGFDVFQGNQLLEYVYATADGTEYIGRGPVGEGTWSGDDAQTCLVVPGAQFDGCFAFDRTEDGRPIYLMTEGTSTLMRLSPGGADPSGPPEGGAYLLSRRDGSQWLVLLVSFGDTAADQVAQVGTELEVAAWRFTDGVRCTTFEDGSQECTTVSESNDSGDFTIDRGGEADLTFQRVTE